MAVQRVAHLEAQRVPSPQPDGQDAVGLARSEQEAPDPRGVGRRYEQLEAVLTRVARPGHLHGGPVEVEVPEGVELQVGGAGEQLLAHPA